MVTTVNFRNHWSKTGNLKRVKFLQTEFSFRCWILIAIQKKNLVRNLRSILILSSHICLCFSQSLSFGGYEQNYLMCMLLLCLLRIQGGSNMTGTDLCMNKPHCAAAVRPSESEATTSTLPPARVRTCSVLSGSC